MRFAAGARAAEGSEKGSAAQVGGGGGREDGERADVGGAAAVAVSVVVRLVGVAVSCGMGSSVEEGWLQYAPVREVGKD